MAYTIIWLPKAEERLKEIVDYLEQNWSEKEIQKFLKRTVRVLHFISENPFMYRRSAKKHIHEALITKHNMLIYRIKNDTEVELLTIFDTRQNPRKKFK